MHIGLFGGTFDPPHIGHLLVAETVREQFALDRIVWMVAAVPPHKPVQTAAADRLALVQAATAGNPRFEVSDLELRRAGPSYTVDTLRALHLRHPGVQWSLLLGGDSLAGFSAWREPEAITRLAQLIVYVRAGHLAPEGPSGVPVQFCEAGRVDVSSTEIRARIAAGRSVRYLVPDAVQACIDARGLYRR